MQKWHRPTQELLLGGHHQTEVHVTGRGTLTMCYCQASAQTPLVLKLHRPDTPKWRHTKTHPMCGTQGEPCQPSPLLLVRHWPITLFNFFLEDIIWWTFVQLSKEKLNWRLLSFNSALIPCLLAIYCLGVIKCSVYSGCFIEYMKNRNIGLVEV